MTAGTQTASRDRPSGQQAFAPPAPVSPALLDIDWTHFHAWRIQEVLHHLSGHPMLQPEALAAAGQRLQATGQFLTFCNQARAGTPFGDVSRLHPNPRSIADTILDIGQAGAWVLLRNVQADPVLGRLVADVCQQIAAGLKDKDPGMCFCAGWVFVSSPNTVTPFHMDKGHNFLFQVRGSKRIHLWDHDDVAVVSERVRDHYHRYHNAQDMLHWVEAFRARAKTIALRPGVGVYMPSTSPHMVETSDEPSVTFTVSFNTDSTRRNALLHALHDVLRSARITPPAVGRHPLLDGISHAGAAALRRSYRRLRGIGPHSDMAAYAPAEGDDGRVLSGQRRLHS